MREEKIKMGEATDVFDMTKKKKGPQAQFQLSKSAACLVIPLPSCIGFAV